MSAASFPATLFLTAEKKLFKMHTPVVKKVQYKSVGWPAEFLSASGCEAHQNINTSSTAHAAAAAIFESLCRKKATPSSKIDNGLLKTTGIIIDVANMANIASRGMLNSFPNFFNFASLGSKSSAGW